MEAAAARGGAVLELARLEPPALPTGQPGVLQVHLAVADAAAAAERDAAAGSAVEVTLVLQGSQLLAHHSLPLAALLATRPAAPVVLVPVPPVTAPSQLLVLVEVAAASLAAAGGQQHVAMGMVLALPEPAAQELQQLEQRVRQELQQPGAAAGEVAARAWRQHLQPLLADVGGLLAGPIAAEAVVASGGQHPLQVGCREGDFQPRSQLLGCWLWYTTLALHPSISRQLTRRCPPGPCRPPRCWPSTCPPRAWWRCCRCCRAPRSCGTSSSPRRGEQQRQKRRLCQMVRRHPW